MQDQVYHNTTHLTGEAHAEAITKVAKQNVLVYRAFVELIYQRKKTECTPPQIEAYLKEKQLIKPNTPITSIRRAISDLTRAGNLQKTNIKVIESFGKPNYAWTLKNNQVNLVM
ncbi:MAG: hypothetical protein WC707_06840 [Candidatus Babeliaceae bacterium]|jgi:hypothetical protein